MNNYYYITEQNTKTQEQLSKYDYDKKKINDDIFDWKLNNMSNKGLNVGLFGKIPNLECNVNSRPVNTGKNKSNKKICDRIFKQYNLNIQEESQPKYLNNEKNDYHDMKNDELHANDELYANDLHANNLLNRINTIDTKNPNNYL